MMNPMPLIDISHASGRRVRHAVRRVVLGVALTVFGGCASKDNGPARTTDTARTMGAARMTDTARPRPVTSANLARSNCQQPGSKPLQVSTDSIAGLPLGEALGQLTARCPSATPTMFNGFESTAPALAFPFDSLRVIGFQHGARLDLLKAADAWDVTGCGGRLPRGVSTCARWSELVAVYGDSGEGNTEFGPAVIHLRALPGYALELDVTDSVVGSLETQPDLSHIPRSARLVHIRIARRAPHEAP